MRNRIVRIQLNCPLKFSLGILPLPFVEKSEQAKPRVSRAEIGIELDCPHCCWFGFCKRLLVRPTAPITEGKVRFGQSQVCESKIWVVSCRLLKEFQRLFGSFTVRPVPIEVTLQICFVRCGIHDPRARHPCRLTCRKAEPDLSSDSLRHFVLEPVYPAR